MSIERNEKNDQRYDNLEKLKAVTFESIDEKDIPEAVRTIMGEEFVIAARRAHPDYLSTYNLATETFGYTPSAPSFEHFLKFADDRVISYIVSAKITDFEKPAECVIMVDVENDKIVGEGTVAIGTIGPIPETEYPFIIGHGNWAEEDQKPSAKRGLGTRRLILFNAYCMEYFGKPLRASNDMSEGGNAIWQRLERLGLAHPIDQIDLNGYQMYQFT